MDPLHPILPVAVNIPPVMPPPSVERVKRDAGRGGRQQREASEDSDGDPDYYDGDYYDDEPDEDPPRDDRDDPGLHIDITA